MAKPHQRAIALITALIFLGTVVVSGIAVVWQIIKDNEQSTAQNEAADQIEEGLLQGTALEGFTPVAQVDKLEIIDLKEGDGEEATTGVTVTAHYTGALAKTGVIFESSHDNDGQPPSFSLGEVIKGWQEGVPGMKVGGKRRIVMPAALAYGEAGSPPNIGPNEPLVFDIELTALPK